MIRTTSPVGAAGRPLAVAHVVLSMDCGGLEHVVLDLIREGRSLGQRADVICLERPGTLAAEAERLGARVFCAGKKPGLRPGAAVRVRALLRENLPDVVHTHQIGALLYAGPAARVAGRPVVVHTEHGKHYAGRLRTRLVGRLAGYHAARFFCVSADIAAGVLGGRIVPRRKVHVIPNGIDTSRFGPGDGGAARRALAIPPGSPVVGTIGRLNEVKRQDVLIRGFALALGRVGDAHLLLVGDGPLKDDLRALAASLGVADRVHFAGYQAEPERFLRATDVFALTSRSEGMPLSVLEAWASAVPVVATRVGGLPELVDDGRTGLLVPPDDPGAVAAALGDVLADERLARRLGEAGRCEVRSRFGSDVMAGNYHRHYRELLSRHGSDWAPLS